MLVDDIVQKYSNALSAANTLWLAYSGGMDSSVLLDILVRSAYAKKIKAVHIHHGLSPNADAWLAHCEEQCKKYGLEFIGRHVEVQPSGSGLEAAARQARYREFENLAGPNDLVLSAHHADDQVETFFLRLARGAGLSGLRAMQEMRPLGQALLLRPFLNVRRSAIESYAQEHNLQWVDDESNQNLRFDRNFIRSEVLPLIDKRWPKFSKRVQAATSLLAESDLLLQEYAMDDFQRCKPKRERVGESIDAENFLDYSSVRQKNLVRYWLGQHRAAMPEQKNLNELNSVLAAREDAQPLLQLGKWQLRRFQQRIYLLPSLPRPSSFEYEWGGDAKLDLGQGFFLERSRDACAGPFVVSSRLPSFRCRPLGRIHSQSLKKLLQEYHLEPWLRDRVPLVWKNGELLAVGDVFSCETGVPHRKAEFLWRFELASI